ncbi:hypothetical protein PROFUN_09419 [Planoprotostelium fungivorum]|uniref:Uncharacterized protein n=1 Tax=Planoprotostelium fungivorum TaxID=1890364 RepID=A0A2P6NHH3_9EUKA|nr:hypothetical protein PROFUN_09419 [Planoprotostelium fungivorum]
MIFLTAQLFLVAVALRAACNYYTTSKNNTWVATRFHGLEKAALLSFLASLVCRYRSSSIEGSDSNLNKSIHNLPSFGDILAAASVQSSSAGQRKKDMSFRSSYDLQLESSVISQLGKQDKVNRSPIIIDRSWEEAAFGRELF